MKRGTGDHPKLLKLATALKVSRPHAIGILELLWAFASRFAPGGDVGKYEDTAIARAVDWHRSPTQLVSALTSCGWLDQCAERRLLVHDWEDHSDQAVKKFLSRHGLPFYVKVAPIAVPVQEKSGLPLTTFINHQPESYSANPSGDTNGTVERVSPLIAIGWTGGWRGVKNATEEMCGKILELRDRDFDQNEDENSPRMIWARVNWFEEFWGAYWLLKGKKKAREAYFAVATSLAVHEKIIAAVDAQSHEMMAREEQHRPHATTWIHGARWNDMPSGGFPPPPLESVQ